LKISSSIGVPLLGAVINRGTGAAAFSGGHNLHHLTLAVTSLIIPVFPSNCPDGPTIPTPGD
jgi:hypothetical protein